MRAEITDVVQFYDTDSGGVVSNIAYLRYVERARSALFEALGMPLDTMMEEGLFPTVIRTEIDYRRPARLGETVVTTAVLAEVEKVRVACDFRLEGKSESGESVTFATARQYVALVKMPEGRPRRIPREWAEFAG